MAAGVGAPRSRFPLRDRLRVGAHRGAGGVRGSVPPLRLRRLERERAGAQSLQPRLALSLRLGRLRRGGLGQLLGAALRPHRLLHPPGAVGPRLAQRRPGRHHHHPLLPPRLGLRRPRGAGRALRLPGADPEREELSGGRRETVGVLQAEALLQESLQRAGSRLGELFPLVPPERPAPAPAVQRTPRGGRRDRSDFGGGGAKRRRRRRKGHAEVGGAAPLTPGAARGAEGAPGPKKRKKKRKKNRNFLIPSAAPPPPAPPAAPGGPRDTTPALKFTYLRPSLSVTPPRSPPSPDWTPPNLCICIGSSLSSNPPKFGTSRRPLRHFALNLHIHALSLLLTPPPRPRPLTQPQPGGG